MNRNLAIIVQKLNGGGAEKVAANLSLFLPGRYNKHVIVYNDENICYTYDGKLICVNTKATPSLILKLINNVTRFRRIRKIKSDYCIQSTISLVENPNLMNIFTRQKGENVVVSVRDYISSSSEGAIGRIYRLLVRLYYNKADCVVAVSKLIKADLVRKYGIADGKIKVIYNPYDVNGIRKLAAEDIDERHQAIYQSKIIINIGRCTGQKGQHHLIRIFNNLKDELPDVNLVILGEGALQSQLEDLVKAYRLEDRVFLLGFQTNPYSYLSRSWLFVLTSLYEGFPNSLVEALCCGVPVISTDCKSGPREILAPDTDIEVEAKGIEYARHGILAPRMDGKTTSSDLTAAEAVIAASIIELYKKPELHRHYAELGSQRAEDFSSCKIMSEFEAVL